jgi:antitoxin ParD1/3/4
MLDGGGHAMTTLSVTLSESLKEFVEAQAAAGNYASAGDYVLALLREAQKRQAWAKVEALVLEGLNSGEAVEVTEEYWEAKRRRLGERYPEANNP